MLILRKLTEQDDRKLKKGTGIVAGTLGGLGGALAGGAGALAGVTVAGEVALTAGTIGAAAGCATGGIGLVAAALAISIPILIKMARKRRAQR